MISVHTPEFPYEKRYGHVESAVKHFKITQPVYLDNDYAYWKSLNNNYWPSFYLIDKQGQVKLNLVGEIHKGSKKAKKMEGLIHKLLRSPAEEKPSPRPPPAKAK